MFDLSEKAIIVIDTIIVKYDITIFEIIRENEDDFIIIEFNKLDKKNYWNEYKFKNTDNIIIENVE